MRSRTRFASQPTARMSPVRYKARASSELRRSRASTFSCRVARHGSSVWKECTEGIPLMIQASRGQWLVARGLGPSSGRGMVHSLSVRCTQQQVRCEKNPKHYGNDSIHGKKGGVQFTQIIRGYQAVLVSQQQKNGNHTDKRNLAETKHGNQDGEQDQHQQVEQAGDPQSVADAKIARNRMQSRLPVEVQVLAR